MTMFSALLIDKLLSARSSSVPLSHLSLRQTDIDGDGRSVGYMSEPNGRGTCSLVVSCLLTLILCVWSALHLNVPAPNNNIRRSLWTNIKWIVAGIYCPELVVFTAWRQWSSARMLQSSIETMRIEDDEDAGDIKRKQPLWTMTHSFFASTGGFAIDLDTLRNALGVPAGDEDARLPRLTLTARGMMLIAKYGELPFVETEEITDKSKANALAKATVLVQCAWLFLQVMGRLAAKLPVTLLEINTVAHVICTFALYLFWWHKPLLPRQPIIVRDENLGPLVAVMYSSSEISGHISRQSVKSQTVVKTLFAHLNVFSTTPEIETLCFRYNCESSQGSEKYCQSMSSCDSEQDEESCHLRDGHTSKECKTYSFQELQIRRALDSCVDEIEACREKDKGMAFFERRPRVGDHLRVVERPSHEELNRWQLIQNAFEESPRLFEERVLMTHKVQGLECIHLRAEQLVATHIPSWPSNDLLRNVDGLAVGIILWFANFCYGSFHIAAWNEHFPTDIERWLWRSSALYISFCGGLWIILNYLVAHLPRLDTFWEKWMDGKKGPLQTLFVSLTVFLCGLSFVLARLYIIVEAFVSIRALPVQAYDTPQWSSIFPHF